MSQKKAAEVMYGILLLVLVFTMGFFVGRNQVAPEVQITVEAPAERPALPEPTSQPEADGLINLNTADQQLLDTLPGIGPELAARIIAYRQTYGPFVDKRQIMDVQGIGESRYTEVEQWITVGGNQ